MQKGSQTELIDVEMEDQLEDMIHDLGEESFKQEHSSMYDTLESDSKKPLYLGCKKSLRLLSAVLSLVNVKVKYGWSDESFTSSFSGSAGYAFRGKHVTKNLLSSE